MIQVLESLGSLSWDLAAQKAYAPNTDLPFTLQATNPTAGERMYKLQAQALVAGHLVWYADFLLEGQSDVWFPVAAGQSLSVQGTFSADQTDFTFLVLLVDQATNAVVGQVRTDLVGSAPPGGPPPVNPPPAAPGFDLSPVMGVMGMVLVMGLMGSVMGPLKTKD
ncbi:MAG: hypothetical protein HY671_04965 [Chloroflexi bacterium]|nr:hypothetical protein [Chloroflexota bacterium]